MDILTAETLEKEAKVFALSNFLCDNGLTEKDYDAFMDDPDDYLVWQPFENFSPKRVQDLIEEMSDNFVYTMGKYISKEKE